MINESEMISEFLERRKELIKRTNSKLNPNPNLITISYKDGKGMMVIDIEAFEKLPQTTQKKILNITDKSRTTKLI